MAGEEDETLSPLGELRRLYDEVSSKLDADIIVYDGEIGNSHDQFLIMGCKLRETTHSNVVLMIHTHGGSADAAYRMVRHLRRKYKKFTMYIYSCCKSAGTLIAVGADELVITDFGELGPLDVQMAKPDELGEMSSGLTLLKAMNVMESQAFSAWENFFLQVRQRSGLQITTKTASEIAASMASNLFAPVYAQIEPVRLGEMERATRIAIEYGQRIGQTLKPGALAKLVAEYPSHEFVIDREEAMELFGKVRPPTIEEEELSDLVESLVAPVLSERRNPLAFLDDFIEALEATEETNDDDNDNREIDAPGRRPAKEEESGGGELPDTVHPGVTSDGRRPARGERNGAQS